MAVNVMFKPNHIMVHSSTAVVAEADPTAIAAARILSCRYQQHKNEEEFLKLLFDIFQNQIEMTHYLYKCLLTFSISSAKSRIKELNS